MAVTKPLPASEISVILSGRESERLRFFTQVKSLEPGTSTFKLFCPVCGLKRPELRYLTPSKTSSWGTYILEQTEVTMSNLHLQWNHPTTTPKGSNKASRTKHDPPTLIRLIKDVRAFDARLKRPRSGKWAGRVTTLLNSHGVVELGPGMSSKLLLTVSSGRNHVSRATLKLSGSPGVTFRFQESRLDDDGVF